MKSFVIKNKKTLLKILLAIAAVFLLYLICINTDWFAALFDSMLPKLDFETLDKIEQLDNVHFFKLILVWIEFGLLLLTFLLFLIISVTSIIFRKKELSFMALLIGILIMCFTGAWLLSTIEVVILLLTIGNFIILVLPRDKNVKSENKIKKLLMKNKAKSFKTLRIILSIVSFILLLYYIIELVAPFILIFIFFSVTSIIFKKKELFYATIFFGYITIVVSLILGDLEFISFLLIILIMLGNYLCLIVTSKENKKIKNSTLKVENKKKL